MYISTLYCFQDTNLFAEILRDHAILNTHTSATVCRPMAKRRTEFEVSIA